MPHQLHGVRILTPGEYENLLNQINKPSLRALVQVMLYSGMRYEEVLRLKENPDHFSEKNNSIWVRSGKHKAKSPERYVPLTEAGTKAVKDYLADERTKYPSANVMSVNLLSWAEKAGFEPILDNQMRELSGANVGKERRNVYGMSVKTFRRTWENWLLTICPERVFDIMKAQGHDVQTSSEHYAGAVISGEDIERIRAYVQGWKPSSHISGVTE